MDTSQHSQVPMGGMRVGFLQYGLMEGGRFREIVQWFTSLLGDSLAFPFVVVLGLVSLHIGHALFRLWFTLLGERGASAEELQEEDSSVPQTPDPNTFQFCLARWHSTRNGNSWTSSMKDHGEREILCFSVARLAGCFLLLGISIWTLVGCPDEFGTRCWERSPEVLMVLTYLYVLVLVIISMSVPAWKKYTRRFSMLVLLCVLAVYTYRDLWPLATYNLYPKDLGREGNLLWAKIFVLWVVTVFIPLFVPRRYVPADPKKPMTSPSEEQTCSIASLLFYSYLNPVIRLGYSVPHLTPEQLPPLSDSDHTENLVKRYFPHIDTYKGAKKRHLFFGLMKVFRKEYTFIAISVVGQNFAVYFNPVAINRILQYMETEGEGATVRPWFWILCLFLGPTLSGIWLQWYLFNSTRVLMQAQALITQLIFDHSLRIRFVVDDDDEELPINAQNTDNSAEVESREGSQHEDTENSSTEAPSTSIRVSIDASSSTAASQTVDDKVQGTIETKGHASAKDGNLIGKINSLVTTDLSNIVGAQGFLDLVLEFPLQITLSTVFLYQLLGWSVFVGIASIIVLLPVPGYAASLTQNLHRTQMKMTDARIQDVTEALSVLRMVKVFGWERKMSQRLQEKRNEELNAVWKLKVLESFTGLASAIIPMISMVATFATYTMIMKKSLTPSKLFSSLTVFGILRSQLVNVSGRISTVTRGKVSLDRVTHFLQETELLDSLAEKEVDSQASALITVPSGAHKQDIVGFKNAIFTWYRDIGRVSQGSKRQQFKLRISDELVFKQDCINLIVGPTGSGKTSILMALLGEMHFTPTATDSWFNLPRDQGIAYAAQESWVQSDTIRNNILFGSPFDEDRYRKVLHQCALERDLDLFDAGDATEVGEKGITLSGGQKARITLARAIYSNAKILLLDDVLAALDVHTAVWIVNKCLSGDLVKGRTVLLVSHNVALVSPIAGFIGSMRRDGTVRTQGHYSEDVIIDDSSMAAKVAPIQEDLQIMHEEVSEIAKRESSENGKLILAEEITTGRVSRRAWELFFSGLGGDHPFIFHTLWISAFLLSDSIKASQTWFLGFWGSQYETHDPSEVSVPFYLLIYTSIIFAMMLLDAGSYLLFVVGTMRASRRINTALVNSVLTSTLRWLDETPTARIITRCTQDIGVVDGSFSNMFLALSNIVVEMAIKMGVILIFTPLFLIPAFLLVTFGLYLGNIYMKSQLSVKREASNAHAPVLGHFSAAISGIISLRAYGAQVPFINESRRLSDFYLRVTVIIYSLNRWIGIRMTILGSIFTTGLATYLVYGRTIGSANTGFSLAFAAEFSSAILWWVKFYNEFEIQANSLERIQGYIDIDHEPPAREEGKPPAAWPTSGNLVIENLSARYSKGGPTVLHNISFGVESGQRIGIVGRTGSGKSSLTLALLRCILTEGTVYYDGIATDKINLDALRSNITIIPQSPELINDTLRRNLDPFEQYDDATLNSALRSAGLFNLQDEEGYARVTLDSKISSGGSNLSVGERQIIALARAMVRGSKLLILDEATSAIDYKTDTLIQATLRKQLAPDVTVITVAHRLQTVIDADKIMVLEDGRMVEFDSPLDLLQREGGFFKNLVDRSGDKVSLYAMAEGKKKICNVYCTK